MTLYQFDGFPKAGLDFMQALVVNNNKEWFEANKQTYLTQVQAPAVALVATLGEALHTHFPEITYDTRTNGGGSLLRIYRDTRFSADKSPYKTNIAMMFSAGGKKMESAGFGLQITTEQIDVVTGIFTFTKTQLEAYRKAIAEYDAGESLEKALKQIYAKGDYVLGGETYKRVPSGYSPDHPHAKWLKFSGLTVYPQPLSLDLAQKSELVDVLMAHFIAMSPVYIWLNGIFGKL